MVLIKGERPWPNINVLCLYKLPEFQFTNHSQRGTRLLILYKEKWDDSITNFQLLPCGRSPGISNNDTQKAEGPSTWCKISLVYNENWQQNIAYNGQYKIKLWTPELLRGQREFPEQGKAALFLSYTVLTTF